LLYLNDLSFYERRKIKLTDKALSKIEAFVGDSWQNRIYSQNQGQPKYLSFLLTANLAVFHKKLRAFLSRHVEGMFDSNIVICNLYEEKILANLVTFHVADDVCNLRISVQI
jgi:hypothetical protein